METLHTILFLSEAIPQKELKMELSNKTTNQTGAEFDIYNHDFETTYRNYFQFDTQIKQGLIVFNCIVTPINLCGHIGLMM